MKGRSTSWFDRGELRALFKGVKPPRPGEVPPPPEGVEPKGGIPGAEEGSGSPSAEGSAAPAREGEVEASLPPAAPIDGAPPVPPVPESPAPEGRPLGEEATLAAPAPASGDTSPSLEVPTPPGPPPPLAPSEAPPPVREPDAPSTPFVPPEPVAPFPAVVATPGVGPVSEPVPPPVADPLSEDLLRHSEALLHLARGQAAAQALEERLWEITETAVSVLSLSRAGVWTFADEERTRLQCADAYSAARDAHDSGQVQVARDYPLYFAALRSERPIVAHDAHADPRTRELVGGAGPPEARIEAPVLAGGRLSGVLRLEHEGSPRRFEHHEERFAASLADLCGLALDAQERRLKEAVAQAGEERVRGQRDALAELSRSEALVRGRLEGVLHEVTEAAARVLRLERSSVWVYAPDYESLFCLDSFEQASGRHDRGAEILGERAPRYFESLRGGGRLSLLDARTEPRLSELAVEGHVPPGISSRLEVPIHLLGRLAGVVWCERGGSPKAWLADEERFAEALAGFVALIIATSERRRNENELRRALEDLDRSPEPAPPAEAGSPTPPGPAPSHPAGEAPPGRASAPDAFEEDLS